MELADREHGGVDDASTYDPFSDEDAALMELRHHSNPGGHDVHESGERPMPSESPDGSRVRQPGGSGFRF